MLDSHSPNASQGRSGRTSDERGVNAGHSNGVSDSLLPALSGSLCVISASAADSEPRWFIRTSGANVSRLPGRADGWVSLQLYTWLQLLCSFQLILVNSFDLLPTCVSLCLATVLFNLKGTATRDLRHHFGICCCTSLNSSNDFAKNSWRDIVLGNFQCGLDLDFFSDPRNWFS